MYEVNIYNSTPNDQIFCWALYDIHLTTVAELHMFRT